MEQRTRRSSTASDVALRTRRKSMADDKASSSRRASIAAFMAEAPRFTHSVVEHIVLFRVKDKVKPEETAAMLEALNGLRKLEGVLQITVGRALSVQGPAEFTHVLHGRFRDKAALAAYSAHPDHATIVKQFMLPHTTDIIALDWECVPCGPFLEQIGAKRITLLKIKDGTPEADVKFLEDSIQHLPSKCPTVGQVSAGSNFSPERAQGFTYGILELFPSTEEEEEVFASCEHMAWQDTKIKPIAASLILADYHADNQWDSGPQLSPPFKDDPKGGDHV